MGFNMIRLFLCCLCLSSACLTDTGEKSDSPCYELCDELYGTCDYAAFPDYGSCLEGCVYSEEQGADTTAQAACVLEAGCDTFEIIECENTHGEMSNE